VCVLGLTGHSQIIVLTTLATSKVFELDSTGGLARFQAGFYGGLVSAQEKWVINVD
jgi:hypothetical protein